MLHNLLIYRLVIFNVLALAGIVWAWDAGYIDYLAHDQSRLSLVILSLFAVGMGFVFQRAWKVSRYLNAAKEGLSFHVSRDKFLTRNGVVEFISGACVTLGFLGTVIGIIAMLLGIESDGSLDSVKGIIESIRVGGGVAFITTGTGLVCALWLDFNAHLLHTASVSMIEDSGHA